MEPVTREKKEIYDEWDNINSSRKTAPCSRDPFVDNLWIHHHMFPELLLIYNDYVKADYIKATNEGCPLSFKEFKNAYHTVYKEAKIFPCWVIPEEEVLRIMAEMGIL